MIGPASLSPWNTAEVVPTARAAAAPGSQSGSEGDLCRTQGSCCLGGSAGGEQLEVRSNASGGVSSPSRGYSPKRLILSVMYGAVVARSSRSTS
jgi:hypothetical protein